MINNQKSIQDIYIEYWKNYFNFKDRSTRKEYWTPTLINLCINFLLAALTIMSFSIIGTGSILGSIFGILFIIFIIANLIPSYAIYFRRFRDAGRQWITALIALLVTSSTNILSNFMENNDTLTIILSILVLIIAIYQLVILLLPSSQTQKQKWI